MSLLGLAACKVEVGPCNVHLDDGESLTVEILSKADPALVERPWYIDEGLPSCGDLDVVKVGARFPITLKEHPKVGPTTACYDFLCPVDFPSPAEPTPTSIGEPGGVYVCLNGASKLGLSSSCEVQRFVALRHGDIDSIYEKPDANGTSSVTLLRALMITSPLPCSTPPAGFPQAPRNDGYFCYDQWNVQLTKAGK